MIKDIDLDYSPRTVGSVMMQDAERTGAHSNASWRPARVPVGAGIGRVRGNRRQLLGVTFAIALLVLWPGCGLTADKNSAADNTLEIEYGYPDQSIFVATINDKGQPDTPMTRVADALLTRAGLSWRAMPYPARRLFKNLRDGTTPFSILVRASSLLESCIFSKDPIYSTELNVYYIGDKPVIRAKEDLIGQHIITIRGYSYGGLLKFISDPANKIKNEVTGTHRAAFEMLRTRRADYLIDYASAAGDILSQNPITGIGSTSIDQLDIYLVLSKRYPDAERLMVTLEKIAATLDIPAILNTKPE